MYMNYCNAIDPREATLVSKRRFYNYELIKIIDSEECIGELTKKRIENHINYMRDIGYKGNYYQNLKKL